MTLHKPDPNPPPPSKTQERKTLRDDFAMVALTGLIAALDGPPVVTFKRLAEDAYHMADAMMEARK